MDIQLQHLQVMKAAQQNATHVLVMVDANNKYYIMKKIANFKKLNRFEQKNIFGGKAQQISGSNKCCWDAYPNVCSECTAGTSCESGSHLVEC